MPIYEMNGTERVNEDIQHCNTFSTDTSISTTETRSAWEKYS